jgi:transposase-like protein
VTAVADQFAGTALDVPSYLGFLDREYLGPYVARGGAAVKLLATDDDAAAGALAAQLGRTTPGPDGGFGEGFVSVGVDAVTTRVHLIDQVFAEIARQLDWLALAGSVVRAAYAQAGFPPPEASTSGQEPQSQQAPPSLQAPPSQGASPRRGPGQLAVSAVARHHDLDPAELYRSVRRALEQLVLRNSRLGHEFRTAMFRLCQHHLGRGDVSRSECETVIAWLRAERVPAAELRTLALTAKLARHNARSMLLSLTHWIRLAGRQGLILRLDLSRLAVARRPPAGLRDGYYYSKAATLDVYELVRQLIDGTDEFDGLFVAVVLPQDLVHDETRGLPAYSALRLRVFDEVRDRFRANPYSTLVRIAAAREVPA